jgi:thiol:disulfide interchange protein DsbD
MHRLLCLLSLVAVTLLSASAQSSTPLTAELLTPTLERPAGDTATLLLRLTLAPGWYTYSFSRQQNAEGIGPEPLQIQLSPPSLLRLAGQIRAPKPQRKYDEGFQMTVEYYTGRLLLGIPVRITAEKPGTYSGSLILGYQVCDSTRCLPPEEISLPIRLTVLPAAAKPAATKAADSGTPPPATTSAEASPEAAATLLQTPENLWLLLGIAAGAGAFALLTPCVFPMIPITVSFFTKRAERNRRRILKDAALYALGIMFTFVGLGFLAALLFGATGIQEMATNPWLNLFLAALFVAFALNLFGAYELVLPAGLLNRLHRASERHGVVGVLLMGLTFSLTSFTCTVPFVGTALVAIASGKWFYPLLGMGVFAAVFAAPFFLLALFPAALSALPRAGSWMNTVKVVMGFLEIAAAMKFLSNADLVWGWGILSRELFLASWIVCGLFITLSILGIIRLPHDTPVEHLGVGRLLAALFFGTLTVWLTTGLWGKPLGELDAFLPPRDYYQLLKGSAPAVSEETSGKQELSWYDRLEPALKQARQEQRPIFLDFTGFTCTNCRWMENNVFTHPTVEALLKEFVRVRLFTDRRTEPYLSHKRFQQEKFGTVELPFYAVLSPEGRVLATAGFTRDIDAFAAFLRRALGFSSTAQR